MQNILAFLTIDHLQAESAILQETFLHVIPIWIILACYQVTNKWEKHSASFINFSNVFEEV